MNDTTDNKGEGLKTPRGPSRRRFLTAGAATAIAAGTGPAAEMLSGQSAPLGPVDETTTVLVNGKIHTMDAAGTVANSVTIRHNRIVAVGGSTPKGANVRVINLRGRTVVPGLIEPHIHIVSLGNRPGYHTILENTTSIAEVQAALAARRKDAPAGAWITSMGGWHPNQWAEHRHPTLAELDAAVPDRPVLLYERFTGPAATNTLGKKYFDEIDAGPLVHPDYKKVNVAANGAIAGVGFAGKGGPASSALYLLRRLQTFDDKKRSTMEAMQYSASVGLTSNLDQVLFPTPGPLHPNQILSNLDQYRMYDAWLDHHRNGRTIVRLQTNFLQNQNDPALPELKERLRNQFQFFGDDMMQTGSIGEWAAPINSGAVWRDAQHIVGQAGWRNENAVQNINTLRQVVEEWEAVNKENDITKLRWTVHHVPEVNADLLNRLKAMGCGVEIGAFRWVTSSDPKVVAGPPFRTIFDHGIQVGMHGDGVHIAPLNPWLHIYYAVTGINSLGDHVNPGQQLTRAEALQLFTRNNAWFLRMEDKIGTIERGKLADVVVLDRDYFTVPDPELKKIRSVLTIVDGKVVHDAKAL